MFNGNLQENSSDISKRQKEKVFVDTENKMATKGKKMEPQLRLFSN